jgi:hypothetical protein
MKNSLLLFATLALPALGRLTLHQRDVPSVVTLDIKRKDVADPVARDRMRRKRDKTIGQNLDNEVCPQSIRPASPISLTVTRKPSITATSPWERLSRACA